VKRLALLRTLLEREQKRRDEQMAAVRAAVANAETQQQQAEGLATYRTDYCRKWSAQFQQAATIEILRSYQGFLSRLDQAITQQQSVLEHAHRMVEAHRQRLVQREIRVATVERLIQLDAYTPSADPELDAAVKMSPKLTALLQQDMHERATMAESRHQLTKAISL